MLPPLTYLPVLLYHHVGPTRAGIASSLTVSPERFAGQLAWLRRRGFVTLSITDLAGRVEQDLPLPRRSVLITFDDGYADLAEYAFPAIRDAGMRATVFVVTARIAGTNTWDEALSGGNERLLSGTQVRSWSRAGIDFGAHTRTHADLTRLSEVDLESEMLGSKRDLEGLLDRDVEAFAYPWGLVDARAHALAARNFVLAFVDQEGRNARAADRHLLRRSMVQARDTRLDFTCRAQLGWSPPLSLRHRLGAVRRALASTPGGID